MAVAAIPLIASVAGSAMSSQGAKKAAKKAGGPKIPAQFQGSLGSATGLINSSLQGRGPGFGGPFVSELMNQGGLNTALQSLYQGAQSGINPQDLTTIRNTYAPLFQNQKSDLLAGIRQAQATRGTYFGSGALQQEVKGLSDLIAGQGSQVIGLAQNQAQLRNQAASAIPNFFLQGLAALQGPQQFGINSLASIMGGTPFYNPASAPNAGMNIGGALSNLGSSQGFNALIQGKANQKSASAAGGGGKG